MSFDNYYCDLEDDDCFAVIPHDSYKQPRQYRDGETCNHNWLEQNTDEYIDILVFKKKIIFRIWKKDLNRGPGAHPNNCDYRSNLYIIFTIKDNLFNNQIIIDLYGITPVHIIDKDIFIIPIFSQYLKEWNYCRHPTTFRPHYICQNYIKTVYNFKDYLSSIGGGYSILYKTSSYPQNDDTISIDQLLLRRDNNRANLKNVLIYKLYHLCKNLKEKHTKKEIHYATLEDKMAEMQTEMRIKDTYTEETEQIRRDILEYKEKCISYVKSIEELQKKCLTLEMANIELEKNAMANINIEDISKELKLLCKSIESNRSLWNEISNSNF